jgi:hypothetical protein
MIELSNYSCDKCAREFSRHCNHCYHTADKKPTRFKRKKKTGIQTPEFRKPTPPPPPPTSGSNAHKPNPNYVPPASVKKSCQYETPCGWCCKWDKKCDEKIGCESPSLPIPKSHAQKTIDYIKSGKGLPPLGFDDNFGLQTINERKTRR